MTTSQIKTRFLIELDAVASGAAPGFTDAEISELVDKAQKDLILQLAMAKKWDDLYTLITKQLSTVGAGTYGIKSYSAALPSDFGYVVLARVKAYTDDIPASWFICDEINYGIAGNFMVTPYNQPFFKNPVIFFWDEDGSTEEANILVDYHSTASTTDAFELTYVKIPANFWIDTDADDHTLELPETLHDTVIAMAVQEAVKSLQTAKQTSQ